MLCHIKIGYSCFVFNQIRRRRLLRLSALDATPSSSTSRESVSSAANLNVTTPSTPGPSHPQSAPPGLSPRDGNPWSAMDTTEADEATSSKSKNKEVMDVDSGIENMEVEENDRKEIEMADVSRVSNSNEASLEQVTLAVGRVLCVSWNEQTEDAIYLSRNAVATNEDVQEPDYPDLVSQSLMDVLCQFANGDNPLQGLSVSTSGAPDDSPSSPGAPHNPVNLPPLPQCSNSQESAPKQTDGLCYLMSCYSRVAVEERNHPKVKSCMNLNLLEGDNISRTFCKRSRCSLNLDGANTEQLSSTLIPS